MNNIEVFTESLNGLRAAQAVRLASVTLLLYEHLLSFPSEVALFWSGSWTFSRVMYFAIRYLGAAQALVVILGDCTKTLWTAILYSFEVATIILCQAALTIRVWYMFNHSSIVKVIAVNAFVASTISTSLLGGFLWPSVEDDVSQISTVPARTSTMVWLYVPSLLLHSFVFVLQVYRFVTSSNQPQKDTLLWRFFKEGMAMYACALGSLLFIVVGLTMTSVSQIPVYEAAFTAGVIFVAVTVTSVCRAMLSIKSLAATMHVDPGWLLNQAELSRVRWHQGTTEGEIVVETFGDSYNTMSGSFDDTDSTFMTNTKERCSSPGILV